MSSVMTQEPMSPVRRQEVDAVSPVGSLASAFWEEPRQPCIPTPDEIRVLAYHKWVAAGCPPGDGVNFWLEAEQELIHQLQLGHVSAEHESCRSM